MCGCCVYVYTHVVCIHVCMMYVYAFTPVLDAGCCSKRMVLTLPEKIALSDTLRNCNTLGRLTSETSVAIDSWD